MAKLPVQIRPLAPSDADEVQYVARRLPDYFQEGGVKHLGWAVQDRDGLVAIYGGQLVGFVIHEIRPPTAEILWLGVLPFYQRRGVGRELVDALVSALAPRGDVCVIEARTMPEHEDHAGYAKTRRFYESMGFRLIGVEKGHFADGTDAAVYRRNVLT